jgi:hypothetical protein
VTDDEGDIDVSLSNKKCVHALVSARSAGKLLMLCRKIQSHPEDWR